MKNAYKANVHTVPTRNFETSFVLHASDLESRLTNLQNKCYCNSNVVLTNYKSHENCHLKGASKINSRREKVIKIL